MDRLILSKALDELDVDYKTCASAEEFLPLIKEFSPDLCLVDLNIERANDGTILIEAIRNILGASLPIIVISANDNSEDIVKNLKIGANDFICKPIDKALLSSKIANFLTNEKIKSKRLPLFEVPKTAENYIEIRVEIELEAITETGVEFRSKDLSLVIGSTIKIENELLIDVFPENEFLYLNIKDIKNDLYISEFQDLVEEDIHRLRLCIANKR
jgi:DNA-binding response OmpR family regulator